MPQERKQWNLKAAGALTVVPGLGRARAGRLGDGMVSFLMVVSLAASAHKLHLDGKQIRAGIMGTLSLIFWLADMRSAGLSPAKETRLPDREVLDHVSR